MSDNLFLYVAMGRRWQCGPPCISVGPVPSDVIDRKQCLVVAARRSSEWLGGAKVGSVLERCS